MPTLDTILQLADRIRTSLWFVPGLMALGAIALALLALAVDRRVGGDWVEHVPLVFSGRPAGARAVLSTIATAMIGTAGVVFSMTIVSLQLASSQFGPRLLRTFLRDRGNQVVFGAFIGIFLYCILVLPAVDARADAAFVPNVAVSTAVVLAIFGLAMLVYFIDNVAQSIHADAVIRSVGAELDVVIDRIFPETIGESAAANERSSEDSVPERPEPPVVVAAQCDGYLRTINGDVILALAAEKNLLVRFDVAPGQFIFEGDRLASVWSSASLAGEHLDRLRNAFVLGAHRTTLQDPRFAFEQLTEMAVRALSAGINDPTTAIHCVDRIGSGLARLVTRGLPDRLRRDDDGVVRIVAEPVGVDQILPVTIEPIGRNAGVQMEVWVRLLEVLAKAFDAARRPADRAGVRACAAWLVEQSDGVFERGDDRERLREAAAWRDGSRASRS